jgi:uncharacterized protein YfaS (alpha-2-macroglobulin family)
MTEQVFRRGQTVECYAEVKTQAGAYVDPTSIVVTILDPNGVAKVTAQAMTKLEVGKYAYYYTVPADGGYGWWVDYATITDGSGAGAKVTMPQGQFEVREIGK